jgi:Phosphodiester glycosidase
VKLILMLAFIFTMHTALAAPLTLNGSPLQPNLETEDFTLGEPAITAGQLERLGVNLLTSSLDPSRLRLRFGAGFVEFSTATGWRDDAGNVLELPAPSGAGEAALVPLRVLERLRFSVTTDLNGVNLTTFEQVPTGGLNQVSSIRASRRPAQVSLSFAREPAFTTLERSPNRWVLEFQNTAINDAFVPIGGDGLSRVRWWQSGLNARLEVELTARAVPVLNVTGTSLTISAEANPALPSAPRVEPFGVNYTVSNVGRTKLHLVGLDPARFQPRVLVAPTGGAWDALEFANRSGAVAVVNGGYFDPPTLQAVDHLVSNGQTLAYWRGARAGVGFTSQGVLWGAPRTRLTLDWAGQKFTVNSIQPQASAKFLTLFQGDGFASVGGLGFTTLTIAGGVITSSRDEAFTPAPGEITLTFDPLTVPKLAARVGEAATVSLTSSDPVWAGVTDALGAGPRLVKDGLFAVDPKLEGFDTTKEIWRPTRQVAFGVDVRGWYVIAMLELGSPEEFARALITAGLRDAMRLDSGSSAQVALGGGLIAGKWGRTVPNALGFVPR